MHWLRILSWPLLLMPPSLLAALVILRLKRRPLNAKSLGELSGTITGSVIVVGFIGLFVFAFLFGAVTFALDHIHYIAKLPE
jgi:hypothetical protein